MPKIEFIRENISIQAEMNQNLLELMRLAGLTPDAPCGGQGKCGKCRVRVYRGQDWEEVLSCQETVQELTEKYKGQKPFAYQIETIPRESQHRILLQGSGRKVELDPDLHQVIVTVPPCPKGDSASDWTRLCQALGKEYPPRLELLSNLAPLLRRTGRKVTVVYTQEEILDILDPGSHDRLSLLQAAFDIGTTTVAGFLLDAETGEILATASSLNPQTEYGGDVIMRANYALEHGTSELSSCIRSLMGRMILEMCSKTGAMPQQIYQVSAVGNTCMHHLLLDISPDSLVFAPYNPVTNLPMKLKASRLLENTNPNAQLLVLPVIAGFVGADTVGCLLAVNMEEEEKMTLMIDIGTNGEIVLGNKKRRITCSTAAGPAFEGAKIFCGMRGAEGAVDHVTLTEKDGKKKLCYSVIGGGKPLGICGSGLIDLVARLLDLGQIDDSGRLEESENTIIVDNRPAWLLFPAQETQNGKAIFLTQQDIREVQLAKGAMAAGMSLLADKLGITLDQVEQVFIAGAFGNYMDPQSACRIGLLPPQLKDRIRSVGNAAGEGARFALLSSQERMRAARLALSTEFLELAALPEFQDRFVDEMEFPEEL